MKCRVIFPAVRSFPSLKEFFKYTEGFIKETRVNDERGGEEKYAANFFLFGEDMLGTLIKFNVFSDIGKIVENNKVRSLISYLQRILSSRDFIIFSLYSHVGYNVLNAVYLVCKERWYFDFKRKPTEGDNALFGELNETLWNDASKKSPKRSKHIKSGDICINNLHMFVCGDINIVPKTCLGRKPLVFVPACGLAESVIRSVVSELRAEGYVFINDPRKQRIWDIPLNLSRQKLAPVLFDGRSYICSEFEIGP